MNSLSAKKRRLKLAMPVSPYPTFPRKREKGQTNRCACFTLNPDCPLEIIAPSFMPEPMQSWIDCGLSPKPFKPLPSSASHGQSQHIFISA